MKRAGALLIIGAALAFAAPSQAVLLVTPQGKPVGGIWQRWADESQIATIHGPLRFTPRTTTAACGTAIACSYPGETFVSLYNGKSEARDALYFELGHQFDWQYLTPATRRYLARKWGTPHARWWDTPRALSQTSEDGLQGEFAQVYRDCAYGINDRGALIGLLVPLGKPTAPVIYPTINSCVFLRSLVGSS